MSVTSVLIVEDHALFRQMLRSQLGRYPEIQVVGEASSGLEAVEKARAVQPDVVLMDIELGPGPSGIEAGYKIKAMNPAIGIVLLSMHVDRQFIVNAAGWSYLLKKNVHDVDVVVRAIKGSSWGMIVIDPEVTEVLRPRRDTPVGKLAPEPARVLELMAQGYSNAAIAQKMGINERMVAEWQDMIYFELGIAREGDIDPRVRAIRAYLEQTRGN